MNVFTQSTRAQSATALVGHPRAKVAIVGNCQAVKLQSLIALLRPDIEVLPIRGVYLFKDNDRAEFGKACLTSISTA